MQVLDSIWASIRGNVKTRINDPIVGAFITTWDLCNWDQLALLFFSTEKVEARIKNISLDMAFLNDLSLIWINYDLLLLPLFLTILYIFILPKCAHKIDKLLKPNQINRHDHTVDLDLNKAIKQKELNKARLRANPDNEFLAKEVKIDIEREKNEAELIITKIEIEKNKQLESKAKADNAALELEKRQLQADAEKRSLAVSSAKKNAVLASHKFPSAYLFIDLLSESFKEDDIVVSLSGLTRCISEVFGYKDFSKLLNDKKFNNDNLERMKYVLIDTDRLTSKFTSIIEDEGIEGFDSDWIFGHLEMIFEGLPYDFIYPETLANGIREEMKRIASTYFKMKVFQAAWQKPILYLMKLMKLF